MGYPCIKKFVVYLKFQCNWTPCVFIGSSGSLILIPTPRPEHRWRLIVTALQGTQRYEDNDILTEGGTTTAQEPFGSPICGAQEQEPVRPGQLAVIFSSS